MSSRYPILNSRFLMQWLKSPALVGAVAPSSLQLSSAMAARAGEADAIVELGAGTGAITRELKRQHPRAPLVIFEQNAQLAQKLKHDFQGARVIAECLHDRLDVLAEMPAKTVIVSSLPFRSLPDSVSRPTISALCAFLTAAPGRTLVQYTYQPRAPFTAPEDFQWQYATTVLRNIPPAGVWVLRATRPQARLLR